MPGEKISRREFMRLAACLPVGLVALLEGDTAISREALFNSLESSVGPDSVNRYQTYISDWESNGLGEDQINLILRQLIANHIEVHEILTSRPQYNPIDSSEFDTVMLTEYYRSLVSRCLEREDDSSTCIRRLNAIHERTLSNIKEGPLDVNILLNQLRAAEIVELVQPE